MMHYVKYFNANSIINDFCVSIEIMYTLQAVKLNKKTLSWYKLIQLI